MADEVYVIAPNARVKGREAGTPRNSTRTIGTHSGTDTRPWINRLLGGIATESRMIMHDLDPRCGGTRA